MTLLRGKLTSACEELYELDPFFRGSLQHASERMGGVGLLSLRNLNSGKTDRLRIMVHTRNEILRVFKRCKSISAADFL